MEAVSLDPRDSLSQGQYDQLELARLMDTNTAVKALLSCLRDLSRAEKGHSEYSLQYSLQKAVSNYDKIMSDIHSENTFDVGRFND